MQVFLDTFGSYLGVQDGMFRISYRREKVKLLAPRKVKAIFLTKGVGVSTNALHLAIEEGIPVILIDRIA